MEPGAVVTNPSLGRVELTVGSDTTERFTNLDNAGFRSPLVAAGTKVASCRMASLW